MSGSAWKTWAGGKAQISTAGGTGPLWSRDGRELFYAEGSRMMAVDVTTRPQLGAGRPKALFEGPYVWERVRNYDIAPDGRFVMLRREGGQVRGATLRVVLNWFEELKRLTPAGSN